MIDEIKAVTAEVQHNGETYTVEPMNFDDQLRIEEELGDNASEAEQTKHMLEMHLSEMDGLGYGEDDSINDVQLGFLLKVVEAIQEANGLEGFTDDQVRQAQSLAQ